MLFPLTKGPNNFRISIQGIEMIKGFEGFKPAAYLDTGGVWTIGWGSTKGITKGMVIDEAEAALMLRRDLTEAETAVNKLVRVPLHRDEFDSLVSFVYNIGISAFKKSTLLKLLNEGHYNLIAPQMRRWVYDNGKKVHGLVKRRAAEALLFANAK